MENKKKVLILYTANSARSEMAEALLKHICQDQYDINSAGTIVIPSCVKKMIKEFDAASV